MPLAAVSPDHVGPSSNPIRIPHSGLQGVRPKRWHALRTKTPRGIDSIFGRVPSREITDATSCTDSVNRVLNTVHIWLFLSCMGKLILHQSGSDPDFVYVTDSYKAGILGTRPIPANNTEPGPVALPRDACKQSISSTNRYSAQPEVGGTRKADRMDRRRWLHRVQFKDESCSLEV